MPKEENIFIKLCDVENAKNNVLAFFPNHGGGCTHYRLFQPATHLRGFGDINYHVSNTFNLAYPDEKLPLYQNGIHVSYAQYDTFIFQRETRLPIFEFMILAKNLRKARCIYEVDDLFLDFPKTNPGYKEIMDVIPRIKYFYHTADDIVCTTEPLRDELVKFNPRTTIIPNAIDFDYFDPFVKKEYDKETIIIGWAGSPFHFGDMAMCEEAVTDIINKYPNVKFMYFGALQHEGDKKEKEFFKRIPKDKMIYKNAVPINEYPEILSQIDIGIIPVEKSRFNECKSNLKYLEFSALGIPTVASKVFPYKCVNHGKTGLLTENDDWSWKKNLELLINDIDARAELGQNARDFVYRNFNQNDIAEYWHKYLLGGK